MDNKKITPEMIEEQRRKRRREYLREWRKRYKEEHGESYALVCDRRRAERDLLAQMDEAAANEARV